MLRPVWFTQVFGTALDRLVHEDARRDRRQCEAHIRFITARVLCACVACAAIPLALLLKNDPALLLAVPFAVLVLLLVPAGLVSRTGNLVLGHHISSVLLGSAIGALAFQTGGLSSAAVPVLVIMLLDPAISGLRRALSFACLVCLAVVLALAMIPPARVGSSLSVVPVAAILVAYVLAIAWMFVIRDERLQTSQMRSQARSTTALDAVNDAVLWRDADGGFSFANAAAHQQLGFDRRDFHESTLFERVNIGDRPAYLKALADAMYDNGHGSANIRIAVDAGPDRIVRMFEMTARRVGPEQKGDALVVVLRDITERFATDKLREKARIEAEHLASSKSRFLATMSHELRTPLNAVIGFSELLLQPQIMAGDDGRRDEYARIINSSGQHLLEVVNAILDMSKIDSGTMSLDQEPVSIAGIVQSSREIVAVRALRQGVSLVEHIPADLPQIVSDRRALKQILLNLFSNAVKFTPAGGEVVVTAARDREHIEIVVSDTGCGIAETDLQQVGVPFFQVRQSYDRVHEGTGLGLSVVRGLVGLMGGTMLIESAPGAGTRVAVRFAIAGVGSGAASGPVDIRTRIGARRPTFLATGLAPTPATHIPQASYDRLTG